MVWKSKLNKLITILTFMIVQFGCKEKDLDGQLYSYITSQCNFRMDTCTIDLRNILHKDFDTLYIFGGYSSKESISLIVENKPMVISGNYEYISGNENDLVILSRNKRIVGKFSWNQNKVSILKGDLIERKGIFDGDTIEQYADIYYSSVFVVRKINTDEKTTPSAIYQLEPIKSSKTKMY